MKKIILIVLLMLCLFSLPVCAGDGDYKKQYEISGAEELKNSLSDEAKAFFEENGLDISKSDWVNTLTSENVFKHIWSFLTKGAVRPVKSGVAILGIIMVTSAVTSFGADEKRFTVAIYAGTLAVTAIIASDVWSAVSVAVDAVKGCSTFMLSFIPIFAGVVALSGATVTSVSMSALLLGASECVMAVASHTVLPLMGAYLGMSVSIGVSPLAGQAGIVQSVKKIATWILSLISTVFVGILGIQTAVNSAADSVTMKTAKFILGTAVPVAGTALSESVSAITASLSLLRSSIGIYGVVALAVMMLPIIAELLMWRAVMLVCSGTSEMFSLNKISGLLKAVDSMLSLLLGAVLLTVGMFIISLCVAVNAGKTV